jgi:hypothetical protein
MMSAGANTRNVNPIGDSEAEVASLVGVADEVTTTVILPAI